MAVVAAAVAAVAAEAAAAAERDPLGSLPTGGPRSGSQLLSWRRTSVDRRLPSARPAAFCWATRMTAPICCIPLAPVSAIAAADELAHRGVVELRRQVALQHRALGPLPLGQLLPSGRAERLRRLPPLLRLPGEHLEHLVVRQLARVGPGDLLGGDRGQRHPQRRGRHLVPAADRRGQVGLQPVLELAHARNLPRHADSVDRWRPARSSRPPPALRAPAWPRWRTPGWSSATSSGCASSRCRCSRPGADPLRLLHLSDLHLTSAQRRKADWIRGLDRLDPDLVVVTGDFLAGMDAVGPVLAALEPLLARPGAFVPGNNDYYAPRFKNPLRYFVPEKNRVFGPELPWPELAAGPGRRRLGRPHQPPRHAQGRRPGGRAGRHRRPAPRPGPLRPGRRARRPARRPPAGRDPLPRAPHPRRVRRRRLRAGARRPHPRRPAARPRLSARSSPTAASTAPGCAGCPAGTTAPGCTSRPASAPRRTRRSASAACRRRPCSIWFRASARLCPRTTGVWRSLVARFVRDEEAAGSNPVTPTTSSHVSDVVRPLWIWGRPSGRNWEDPLWITDLTPDRGDYRR